jgi:hypothetical protein
MGVALIAAAQDATTSKSKAAVSTATKQSPSSSATVKSTSAKSKTTSSKKKKKKSTKVRGQLKIDSQRTQEIQEALIREHYLKGDPTGTWNQATEDALRRFQADNGWQSKTVPDSRALIKLGLGPSKDHLLNPESAMTTSPVAPKSEPVPPTSHSVPAVGDSVPPTSAPAATPASSNTSSPQ